MKQGGGCWSTQLVRQWGLNYLISGTVWVGLHDLDHPIALLLPKITPKQAWASFKNCLKGCDWLLLNQIYFHIIYFSALNIKQNFTPLSKNKPD